MAMELTLVSGIFLMIWESRRLVLKSGVSCQNWETWQLRKIHSTVVSGSMVNTALAKLFKINESNCWNYPCPQAT